MGTATKQIAMAKPITTETLLMSETEFAQWSMQDVRAEWVDGAVILMSPVSLKHVQIASFLIRLLGDFVEYYDFGTILGPKYQMRISTINRRRVPDVLFVAKDRLDILKKNHIEGAPDLVVEIASADSVARDWRDKYFEYEKAGVKEYWVIDPMAQRMEAYILDEQGKYTQLPEEDETIKSQVLSAFYIKPTWFWQETLPKTRDLLRAMDVI